MKVGLIGFGRAGKSVASVLLNSPDVRLEWVIRSSLKLGHRSVPEFLGVESNDPGLIYSKAEFTASELFDKMPVDAIVDFSSVEGIEYYGNEAAKRNITILNAISSYPQEKIDYIQQLSKKTRVLYSPNITIGINFMIIAAKILKNIAPYTDIEIIEEHFKAKPETSGTAKIIAKRLELPESSIKVIRAGGIVGIHEILFGFPYQTIRLKHESISRESFGNGILFALQHLPKVNTGLFSMEDLMIPFFRLNAPDRTIEIKGRKPWWKVWE